MVIDGTEAIVQIGTPASYQAYIYNAVGEVSYLLVETPILTIVTATGGTVTEIDGFTVHTFTSSGNFVVEVGSLEVEYLVVGGGGGTYSSSGGRGGSSGGGAGGLLSNIITLSGSTYNIVVGAGGIGLSQGGNSEFNSFIAYGGGLGTQQTGNRNGASGGGQGILNNVPTASIGTGIDGQGNNGGSASTGNSGTTGGGGGAGAVGSTGTGGIGYESSISGTPTYYAGGGAGQSINGTTYSGGLGGGGNSRTNGTINTGGGAGGHAPYNSGYNGGSGIVIIRYTK